ncbi:MAG: hypothetical protein J5849_00015 [Clostridia bacterium]|nr:hypothetical protein [Clostridia bacterium]
MPEFLEACMVVAFGISWPLNILKSIRSRTAKGKSLLFLIFIWIGYVAGIASKLISGNVTYVFFFYVLNLLMVSFDLILYFRNKRLDRLASKEDPT